jgi:uncharacterized membrane protein YhaH (DUF805 family)
MSPPALDAGDVDLDRLILAVVFAVVVVVVFVAALIVAVRHPAPAGLTLALGLLTLIALLGLIATQDDTFATLAATGIGALAGAVTQQFRHGDGDGD